MGSYVCDLCDGNSRPARSLAFIPPTTGAIACLTNNPTCNFGRGATRVAGTTRTVPLPHPTYFPAGLAMGVAFLFWGLITIWVVRLVGLPSSSQRLPVGSPKSAMDTKLTESSSAPLS